MSFHTLPSDMLPIEEYHKAAPRWLSKSSILDFRQHGPQWWHMRYLLDLIQPKESTLALEQGAALDCYMTEGVQAYAQRYAVKPQGLKLNTKEGKAWAESVEGKEIISAEDHAILMGAIEAVQAHPWYDSRIARAAKQVTFRRDTTLGFGLQSRPDFSLLEEGVYIDLKKTKDLRWFGRDAIAYGYHYQAALAEFCTGGAFRKFYLAACEWELGSRFRIYEIPAFRIEQAREELLKLCVEISSHLSSGMWEDVQQEPEMLETIKPLEEV